MQKCTLNNKGQISYIDSPSLHLNEMQGSPNMYPKINC